MKNCKIETVGDIDNLPIRSRFVSKITTFNYYPFRSVCSKEHEVVMEMKYGREVVFHYETLAFESDVLTATRFSGDAPTVSQILTVFLSDCKNAMLPFREWEKWIRAHECLLFNKKQLYYKRREDYAKLKKVFTIEQLDKMRKLLCV